MQCDPIFNMHAEFSMNTTFPSSHHDLQQGVVKYLNIHHVPAQSFTLQIVDQNPGLP